MLIEFINIMSKDNFVLNHERLYNIIDKKDKGYINLENINLILININDYMINEISNNNPLDLSFEEKTKRNSDYILEKLFKDVNNSIITKYDYMENYQKNSALESLTIKLIETDVYILKKYEINITANEIYERRNTIQLSIKPNDSLVRSINECK